MYAWMYECVLMYACPYVCIYARMCMRDFYVCMYSWFQACSMSIAHVVGRIILHRMIGGRRPPGHLVVLTYPVIILYMHACTMSTRKQRVGGRDDLCMLKTRPLWVQVTPHWNHMKPVWNHSWNHSRVITLSMKPVNSIDVIYILTRNTFFCRGVVSWNCR